MFQALANVKAVRDLVGVEELECTQQPERDRIAVRSPSSWSKKVRSVPGCRPETASCVDAGSPALHAALPRRYRHSSSPRLAGSA